MSSLLYLIIYEAVIDCTGTGWKGIYEIHLISSFSFLLICSICNITLIISKVKG